MHRARALFQRDVFAQNTQRLAGDERVLRLLDKADAPRNDIGRSMRASVERQIEEA